MSWIRCLYEDFESIEGFTLVSYASLRSETFLGIFLKIVHEGFLREALKINYKNVILNVQNHNNVRYLHNSPQTIKIYLV